MQSCKYFVKTPKVGVNGTLLNVSLIIKRGLKNKIPTGRFNFYFQTHIIEAQQTPESTKTGVKLNVCAECSIFLQIQSIDCYNRGVVQIVKI